LDKADPQLVTALVLAGARQGGDALALAHGVQTKAEIEVHGRVMLGYVLRALRSSGLVRELAVSGMAPDVLLCETEQWPAMKTLEGQSGPAASVAYAVEQGRLAYPILVTTCDHVLLSHDIVSSFVERAMAQDCDIAVGMAARDVIEAEYPDVARTYTKLRDGDYSACNLFLLKTPECLNMIRFWQQAEVDRKKPWRIAARFGVFSALRVWLKRVGLQETFAVVSRRMNCVIAPILLPFADAAVDVDKPSDLELVGRVLAKRQA